MSKAQRYPYFEDDDYVTDPFLDNDSYSTLEKNFEDNEKYGMSPYTNIMGRLEPRAELLQLIASFIKLQSELGSKVSALIADNVELIKALTQTFMKHLGNLHQYTLNGIQVFRKILQFAMSMLDTWTSNKHGYNFGY